VYVINNQLSAIMKSRVRSV